MDLNRATILGRLTRDPEARTLPSGKPVSSFAVATNFIWRTPEGEKQEKVEYHNVVAFGKLAEICNQYLNKGRQVYLEGRLQTREWEGQDGVKRTRTEIIADNMILLAKPTGAAGLDTTEEVPLPTEPEVEKPAEVPSISTEEPARSVGGAPNKETETEEKNKSKEEDDKVKVEDVPF